MSKTHKQVQLQTTDGQQFDIPEEGSLGLLALGYVGVMLWREKRQQVQEKRLNQQHAE